MTANPVRSRYHSVTPYLVVPEAGSLIEFLKQALGAEENMRSEREDGTVAHAEIAIGDSLLMIGQPLEGSQVMPASLHLYVADADAAYQRAIQAGAVSLKEPADMDYGDREADIRDLAGNEWYIATHTAAESLPEGMRSITLYLRPQGADKFVDFLKQAFGAEEIERFQSPEGAIAHAKIRIGDSIVELSEAREAFPPMAVALYLDVQDVDAIYERALQSGAITLTEPEDKPYGDRIAGVKDPFGNTWWIAMPITATTGTE